MITLRPRQIKLKQDIRSAFENGAKRILAIAPCAFGKTPTSASIMHDAVKKGSTILFIVHREDLIDTCSDKLSEFEVDHGVLLKDHPKTNPFARVQLSSWQTLIRKIANPKFTYKPDLIIYDEAHRSVAEKSKEILDFYEKSRVIGFTATPYRDDNAGLRDIYDTMVLSCNAEDLMEEGLLVKPEYFNIPAESINITSESEVVMDDLTEKKLGEVEHDVIIPADIIRQYQKICGKEQAIVFCRNVEHAKNTVEKFRKAKITAEFVECHTKNRKQLLDNFAKKKFQILACATLLAEGYDYPDLGCVILYRKMGSRALFRQACNRSMRISPNKKGAYVLDFFDNFSEHGLPWSTEHYSLEYGIKTIPSDKEKEFEEVNGDDRFFVCMECMKIIDLMIDGKEKCASCGTPLQLEKLKKIIVELKNDLQKIDESKVETKKIYTMTEKQDFYTKICIKCIENCNKPSWAAGQYKRKFEVWPKKMKKPAEFIKYEEDYAKREANTIYVSEQLEWKMGL